MIPKIEKINLNKLDVNDKFFNSLKETYFKFDKWFKNKQKNNSYGYVTYKDNILTSLLILKIEEKENYDFDKKFNYKKALKISTFKVADTGKKIGSMYLKIIDDFAKENNVEIIYLTVFEKQKEFINFIEKNNYKYYCNKNTLIKNGNIKKERVYIKDIFNN